MSSHSNYLGAKKCCATNLARTVIGPQGPQGAGGPIGPYGQQGPTGTQGLRGATGPCCRGPPGFTGAQGYQGFTGAQGYQGSTGPGGALGYWGSFWSTETQNNSPLTPKAMRLNNTDPDSNGVSVVANSRITFSNAGVYNIQFSAQVQDTTSGVGDSKLIEIWFSKNGVPIPESNTNVSTDNQNSFVVASWNFILKLNAGDYVEIIWNSTDTGMQLTAVSPVTTGGPDVPSVIVTAQQVMYTQVGATGPQGEIGSTGPQGSTGAQGEIGSTGARSSGYYGSFGSTANQTIVTAGDTAYFNSMYVDGAGNYQVTISGVNNDTFVITTAGTYNIQFSAQFSGTNNEDIYIWLEQNGVSVPFSNTQLHTKGTSSYQVASWNWFIKTIDPNETFRVVWTATDDDISIQSIPTPPYGPGIPSIILTVQQVT